MAQPKAFVVKAAHDGLEAALNGKIDALEDPAVTAVADAVVGAALALSAAMPGDGDVSVGVTVTDVGVTIGVERVV